jgi:hypothetical protein
MELDGLSGDQVNLLKRSARRYIWWQTAEKSLKSHSRILLQVMEIGNWEDCLAIMNGFPRERLVEALRAGTAGTLPPKSWNFWHIRLNVGEPGNPPPTPPGEAGGMSAFSPRMSGRKTHWSLEPHPKMSGRSCLCRFSRSILLAQLAFVMRAHV